MSLHKEIIWARGTSFNVSPMPELPLTSSVCYFVNYTRTQDIFALCVSYVPFILANGTSFNVSPRPELPLTSSIFYFVRYFMPFVLPMLHLFWQVEPLSMSLLVLSCHWQEGVFILWIIQGHRIFHAFSVAYVPFISANGVSFNVSPRPELLLTSSVFYFVNYPRTQDILCFLCCLCSFYFGKWNLFQCLSKIWVTTDKQYFLFCEIFYAFCFAYVAFISASGTSFNVSPSPELPLTRRCFYFVNYPGTQDILCFLCCLCSFYFGKWNLFQCLSKAWVTTDKHCFSFFELSSGKFN